MKSLLQLILQKLTRNDLFVNNIHPATLLVKIKTCLTYRQIKKILSHHRKLWQDSIDSWWDKYVPWHEIHRHPNSIFITGCTDKTWYGWDPIYHEFSGELNQTILDLYLNEYDDEVFEHIFSLLKPEEQYYVIHDYNSEVFCYHGNRYEIKDDHGKCGICDYDDYDYYNRLDQEIMEYHDVNDGYYWENHDVHGGYYEEN